VIVGAGHSGSKLATSLRQHGWSGSITLIGDDPHQPYHRPPLSKTYLKENMSVDDIPLYAPTVYEKANIDLLLGTRVQSINCNRQTVELASGDQIGFDRLVLAVGSNPRRLAVLGCDLDGVCYLRDADDANRIRDLASTGQHAVIIGGGYIGLEAAASLRQLGMEVTVLEVLGRLLARVASETVSDFVTQMHTDNGVKIRVQDRVKKIFGETRVSGVELESGESIRADLVLIGIGIVPNTDLALDAGLGVTDGIEINPACQTTSPNVYAIGDCTSFAHPRYGRRVRFESIQNANGQATVAARSICGQDISYEAVPWFWSDQYDVKLQIAGLSHDPDEIIIRGNPQASRSFSVLYIKNDRLLCIEAVNAPRDFVMGRQLITDEAPLDTRRMADQSITLNDLVVQERLEASH